jgi:deoxyadenosine/deoxycytidine kinase
MIVTLEGAPAVGKSTIASLLGDDVISEVNVLFGKKTSANHDNNWYLQRQLDRWRLARAADQANRLVVLDGDVFQPLWFSALFWQESWGSIEETVRFFQHAAASQLVALPDQFVCIRASEEMRVQRELNRSLSKGRSQEQAVTKANRYKDMAAFLDTYFRALSTAFPGLVTFVDATEPPDVTAAHIASQATGTTYEASTVLAFMSNWCQEHRKHRLQEV